MSNARRQVVDKLVGSFVAIDVFLEKVLQEHEKNYDPKELRDFVDVYIKTRSESGDCSHLYTGEAGAVQNGRLCSFDRGRKGEGEVGIGKVS